MDVAEFTEALRRRWLTFTAVLLLVLLAALLSLKAQDKVYEATSTFNIYPTVTGANAAGNPLLLLNSITAIAPVYAEAASAADTKAIAFQKLPAGMRLASVTVRTFKDAPLVFKVVARSTDPKAAQATADAQIAALVDQARAGKVGLKGLIDVQLVQRAQLPTEPVSPRPKVTMFVALVLGLGFGVGAALLHDNLRRTVDTPDVVSSIFGAPAFGELPLIRGMQSLRSTSDLGSDRQLRVLSEGLRDISTSLQLSVDEYSSLLVTSPQGSHGKSTVAFGLAVSLARSGANTLLVDADMRRGRVEDFFVTEGRRINKSPGLVDVLRRAPIEHIIQRTDLPNLHVLTSGELTDSPGELLDAQFALILPELTRRYDTVIIDGTPLLPINDARVIAKLVDVVLVVVSEGALTRREVRAASDRLRVIQVEPSAVVLNRSKTRRKSGYYAYLSAGRPRTTT